MLHFLQNVQNREFCKLFAICHFIVNLSRSRRWFFCHCWVVARVTARDMPDAAKRGRLEESAMRWRGYEDKSKDTGSLL